MDTIHRFIFEQLDIRGALVQLGPSWQRMQAGRDYAEPVRKLLGELAAVTTLIGGNLKTPGRVRFQLQGDGPVSLLVMDCDEQLRLRGMARSAFTAVPDTQTGVPPAPSFPASLPIGQLLGGGHLMLTLQSANAPPWQSVVPRVGDSVAEIFEHYLCQSEQQPACLRLAATTDAACGLFLQPLPGAAAKDADGWNRIEQLAATVRADELALAPEVLLQRLFAEEDIRLFTPRQVTWHCPRDEEKIRNMLLSLGRDEVEDILGEAEVIAINDEICGHEYRFGPEIIDELFPPQGRLLH